MNVLTSARASSKAPPPVCRDAFSSARDSPTTSNFTPVADDAACADPVLAEEPEELVADCFASKVPDRGLIFVYVSMVFANLNRRRNFANAIVIGREFTRVDSKFFNVQVNNRDPYDRETIIFKWVLYWKRIECLIGNLWSGETGFNRLQMFCRK